MARPKKEIDQSIFEKLCGIQCTRNEICDFLNITDKTLTRWCKEIYGLSFSAIFEKKRVDGKISLRRSQWKLAKTNATMSIWLGKNYLGQRDDMYNSDNKDWTRQMTIYGIPKNAI